MIYIASAEAEVEKSSVTEQLLKPFKRESFPSPQTEPFSLNSEEISQQLKNPWVAKLLENYLGGKGDVHVLTVTKGMSREDYIADRNQLKEAEKFLKQMGITRPIGKPSR